MATLSEADATFIALQWLAHAMETSSANMRFPNISTTARLPVLVVDLVSSFVEENETVEDLTINVSTFVALREMLGVWHVLASCRGFRSYENPRFWTELVRQCARQHDGMKERPRHELLEDEAASDYVMLKLSLGAVIVGDGSNIQALQVWMRDVCRELFQLGGDAELSARYQDTLHQLLPFVDEDQAAKEGIAVDLALNAYEETGDLEIGDPEFLPTYAPILKEITLSSRNNPNTYAPVLRIEKAGFLGVQVTTKREIEELAVAIAANPFSMGSVCPYFGPSIDPIAFSKFLTTAHRTEKKDIEDPKQVKPGKLQAMTYICPNESRRSLLSLFSVLPDVHFLQTLRLLGSGIQWR